MNESRVYTNFSPDFTHHTIDANKSCNNFPLTLHLTFFARIFYCLRATMKPSRFRQKLLNHLWIGIKVFYMFSFTDSAVPFTMNNPTSTNCVNWNQYYTNCTQLGGNPFQGTISFDNIGLAWVAIFLVIITNHYILRLKMRKTFKMNQQKLYTLLCGLLEDKS